MTDDIVTRLLDFTPLSESDLARLLLDASSEIEDLRKDMAFQARVIGRHYAQFRGLRNEIERLREELETYKYLYGTEATARVMLEHSRLVNPAEVDDE